MNSNKNRLINAIENYVLVNSIRNGLITVIPVLIIGAFALIIYNLPIKPYQTFIASFASGAIVDIFTLINSATFGMLSVYITLSISLSYAKNKIGASSYLYGAPITALACFFILTGVLTDSFSIDALGVKGMFTAIITSLAATQIYSVLIKKAKNKRSLYADGADASFSDSVNAIPSAAIIIVIFSLANFLLMSIFEANSFYELYINAANALFAPLGRTFGSGLLFVLLSSVLWFFGIHGSDVLEGVCQHLFVPAMTINSVQVSAGKPPTEILTKTFFDSFVLMGGCGTALCLLIALLFFSKRRNNTKLAGLAAFPMLFNINEMMIFGLPVVYNLILFVPFVLTPVITYVISYLALAEGWVPLTFATVEWTTPVFLSGYTATGSVFGSLL